MSEHTYSFHSSDLQEAFQNSKQSIESYKSNLDHVSEDIKTLEAYLSDQQLKRRISCPVFFEVQADGGSTYPEEAFSGDSSYELKENFSDTPGTIIQHSIVWDEVEWPGGKKKFRLQYESTRIEGSLILAENGKPFIQKPKSRSTDRLALIESPIDTRLRFNRYLPEFIKFVAKELS